MDKCLIVGGGVIGLSLAYELSCRGESGIRVIDRAEPGREASWAGAGILPPANRATAIHPLEQLRAVSHELHPQWAAALRNETGIDNGYRPCGGIYLARQSGEAAALHGLRGLLEAERIEVRPLDADELRRVEPGITLTADSLKAAYLLPGEAQLRNPDHLRALAIACRQRGVQIDSGVSAASFQTRAGQLTGVVTNQGALVAERYCIASGAWTALLLKQLAIPNGIMPIRGQMVMFACGEPPLRHIVNEGSRYLVPRDDGRVLAGSTEEEAGFDKSTTAAGIAGLIRFAGELVTELTPDIVAKTWAGLRPGTYDGFPYLGPVPGLDNVFVAAGHFRSGLHMSPGTAVVMADLIVGKPPAIDLTPFRLGRG